MAARVAGLLAAAGMLGLAIVPSARGENASSGGRFTVIEEAEPGDSFTLTGGTFSLSGGTGPVMETLELSDGTSLRISFASGQVFLDWSGNVPSVVLQQTDQLGSSQWTEVPGGDHCPVSVPATGTARYFRLMQQ